MGVWICGEDGHLYVLDVPTLEPLARSAPVRDAPITAVVPIVDDDPSLRSSAETATARYTVAGLAPFAARTPVQAGPGEITALVRVGRRLLHCGATNRMAVIDLGVREVSVPFAGPPAPAALVALETGSQQIIIGSGTTTAASEPSTR